MNREPQWWKLYLFTAVILVTLFMIPPTDSSALILFMGVVFGGLVLWVTTNQTGIASQERRPTRKVRPVDEFFDELELVELDSESRSFGRLSVTYQPVPLKTTPTG